MFRALYRRFTRPEIVIGSDAFRGELLDSAAAGLHRRQFNWTRTSLTSVRKSKNGEEICATG